jgi:hypothetical protein
MIVGRFFQLQDYGKLGPERQLADYAVTGGLRPHLNFAEFLDGVAEIFGAENMAVKSYKQNKDRLPESALETIGLSPEGFDLDVGKVNKSPISEAPDPALVQAIRDRYRAENERAVKVWFPGQSVEDVFGA